MGVLSVVAFLVLVSLPSTTALAPGRSASPTVPLVASVTYPTPVRHVVVIMMENANASWVLGNGSYEDYLAHQYAYAGNFYSIKHGSNGDYFAATSGNTWTKLQEYSTTDLATLTGAVGLSWATFEQSMPSPCDAIPRSSTALYSPGHNPFVWYSDVYVPSSYCDSHDVGFAPLAADLANGTMPSYSLVVANQQNDSHNLCGGPSWQTPVDCGDAWLRSFLSPILNSTASWARSTAFLISYDEANLTDTRGIGGTTGGGIVYTVAAGDCATPQLWSSTPYSTFSILTTTEWLLGLGHTGHHDSWATNPPMEPLFANPTCGAPPASYTLTTSASPPAGGSVSPASGTFSQGSVVALTEAPSAGFGFDTWTGTGAGSYSGTDPAPTITIGGNVSEVAGFSPLYPVTFDENGLPGGTTWSVTLGSSSASSSTGSLSFAETNGSYGYSVGSVAGYSATPASGTLSVAGAPVVVSISFVPAPPSIVSFSAQPSSIALTSSTTFDVSASGGSGTLSYAYSSLPPGCSSQDTASLPCVPTSPGVYSVGVTVTDSLARSASATTVLTVGTGYPLTFAETGLPSGTSWSVDVGGATLSSTSSQITFYLPAAKYHWVIGAVPDLTAQKPSGTTSLTSSGASVAVSFEHAYLVTFDASGLPPGTTWSILLRTVDESSTTSTISFWAPNGTYAYSIGAVPGYTGSGSPSSVVVRHAPVTVLVTFVAPARPAAPPASHSPALRPGATERAAGPVLRYLDARPTDSPG